MRRYATLAASLLVLMLALCPPAWAHEFRTAYLQITDIGGYQYAISWRVPAGNAAVHRVELGTGPDCDLRPVSEASTSTFSTIQYRLDCSATGAVAGLAPWLELAGLERVPYDALAKIIGPEGAERYEHLHASHRRLELALPGAAYAQHNNLFNEGMLHVLSGYDHLAYMLLLFLFLRKNWKLLLLGVTTFTAAHSLTLALSVTGAIRIPARPVEAVIALTICYFAISLIRHRQPEPGAGWRWQTIILLCGLVHGLGFANSLSAVGFDEEDLLWGLASFNVGIEFAQVLFILAAAVLYQLMVKIPRNFTMRQAERYIATAVGAMGSFWYLERIITV